MKVRRSYLAATLQFTAGREKSRPVLNGVSVRDGEIAAADGFTLAIAPCEDVGSLNGKILDADAITLALKVIPRTDEFVTFRGHKDHAYIVARFGMAKVPYIEGDFPAYGKFLREELPEMGTPRYAVNAGYLDRVTKAAKLAGGLFMVRTFPGVKASDPIEFEIAAEDAPPMRLVVMPMFVQWGAAS